MLVGTVLVGTVLVGTVLVGTVLGGSMLAVEPVRAEVAVRRVSGMLPVVTDAHAFAEPHRSRPKRAAQFTGSWQVAAIP